MNEYPGHRKAPRGLRRAFLLLRTALIFSVAYAHSENPHTRHTAQPPSCSTTPPHSGQAPRSKLAFSTTSVWPVSTRCDWIALATASAQESTLFSPKPAGEWQEMPRSCFTTLRPWMPLLHAKET